jgi:hypothetical protein
MSMSTYVYGIKPADAKYQEMLGIYNMCIKAKVEIPKEVQKFFGDEDPDPAGVVENLSSNWGKSKNKSAVTPYRADMQEGFEVDLSKLDPNIKILRFVNSY